MKKNIRFFTHTSVMWALFILGNAVIALPAADADEFTFLGYLAACGLGLLLNLIALPAAKRLFTGNPGRNMFIKVIRCTAYIITAVFAVFCAADTVSAFLRFIKDIVLINTPMLFIAAVFAAVTVYFATRRQEDVLKFFLISFWFALAVIIFFFIATSFEFNAANIIIFKLPDTKRFISQFMPYFINPVLPSVLLSVYDAAVFGKTRYAAAVSGYITGCVLLGICTVGTVLLFGPSLAGQLDYPYSSAVSTVSIGRLFSRLDGFAYYIYFICALTKTLVCIFLTRTCLRLLGSTNKKKTAVPGTGSL